MIMICDCDDGFIHFQCLCKYSGCVYICGESFKSFSQLMQEHARARGAAQSLLTRSFVCPGGIIYTAMTKERYVYYVYARKYKRIITQQRSLTELSKKRTHSWHNLSLALATMVYYILQYSLQHISCRSPSLYLYVSLLCGDGSVQPTGKNAMPSMSICCRVPHAVYFHK